MEIQKQGKFRSVENRLESENTKNIELKKDLESIRAKLLEEKMVNNNIEELNNELR